MDSKELKTKEPLPTHKKTKDNENIVETTDNADDVSVPHPIPTQIDDADHKATDNTRQSSDVVITTDGNQTSRNGDQESMEFESSTLPPVPDSIIPIENTAALEEDSNSVDKAIASMYMKASSVIVERASTDSQVSTPIENNLFRLEKRHDYSPVTDFVLSDTEKNRRKESLENVPDEKDPSIDTSSSSSYEERNKKLLNQQMNASKMKQLKIKINDQEKVSPMTVNQTEVIQKEECTTEATVTEPIHSLIQSNLDKSPSYTKEKLICMLSVVFMLGFGCIIFGIYEVSLDPSSIPGWLLVSIPIFIFICSLAIRCYCLKVKENNGSISHGAEPISDRTPGSMHPANASQETTITPKNVMQ
jgi:hypothetical protein